MNLPILFRTRTGRYTGHDRPCQSQTSLYYLDMLCHSKIYKIKASQHIPSMFTFLCSLYVGQHCTVCIGIKPLDNFFSIRKFHFIIFLLKYIFIIHVYVKVRARN